MKLSETLKTIKTVNIIGSTDIDLTGINIDSRRIKAGHLFVAMKGTQVDGHRFIEKPSSWELSQSCWKTCLTVSMRG